MIVENKLTNSNVFSIRQAAQWLAVAIACISLIGCRQRAYTELYVEKMASDIRVLEDRVYEFDAAYQSLERENAEQRRINANLEARLRDLRSAPESSRASSTNGLTIPPKVRNKSEPYLLPGETIIEDSPEVVEKPPKVSRTPASPPARSPSPTPVEPAKNPAIELPAPADSSKSLNKIEEVPILPFPDPQALDLRKGLKKATFPDHSLVEQVAMPESMLLNKEQAKTNLLAVPVGTVQSRASVSSLMEPPSPENLSPGDTNGKAESNSPSLLPPANRNLNGNPQGRHDHGRIRLPEGSAVQWASANVPIEKHAQEPILDDKIVEIAFHPTMCRGHNFDTTPGDDGLYLVVTPVNEAGQVINETGVLTIIVEEDGFEDQANAVADSNARIAAWKLSKEELQETLSPIGSGQGFHLSLPWDENSPKGQIVTVYLQFKMDDGRTLVNRRNIQLRKPSKGQSVWSPR